MSSRHYAEQHRKRNIAGQQLGKFNQLDKSFEFHESFEHNNSLQQQFGFEQHNQSGIDDLQHYYDSLCSCWKFARRSFAEYHLARFHHNAEHYASARIDNITEHDNYDAGNTAVWIDHFNDTQHYVSKFNDLTQHDFAGIETTVGIGLVWQGVEDIPR